jgi:L-histidine Nalpha-methyltransferase
MIIFLGSTLGNFSAQECERFLQQVSAALRPGDYFLLGVDLQKDIAVLEAAYNDAQGITAAFNLNMLERINTSFGGNFSLEQFEHRAFYNTQLYQIEMHLLSTVKQKIYLSDLDLHIEFAAGETIHTESSRKFHQRTMETMLTDYNLLPLQSWQDPHDWFSLTLCQRQA